MILLLVKLHHYIILLLLRPLLLRRSSATLVVKPASHKSPDCPNKKTQGIRSVDINEFESALTDDEQYFSSSKQEETSEETDLATNTLLINSVCFDFWTDHPIVVEGSLSSPSTAIPFSLEFLVDTGATGYSFIDERIVPHVCNLLQITPLPLSRPKFLKAYNNKQTSQAVTHCLHPTMTIQGHTESVLGLDVYH